MKRIYLLIFLFSIFSILGCETVKKGTYEGGKYIGKGTDAVGGVSEGAVDGYIGTDKQSNPFNR